jgi:UDP-N-acetyl-D-galactosamine dehydrogenase
MDLTNKKIAIIGLGYVGLPLAVEFAKKYSVIGFDINESRVKELNSGHDSTLEVSDDNLQSVLNQSSKEVLLLSNDTNDLKSCTVLLSPFQLH